MIQPSVALVCSGPVSRTALTRLPSLSTHLARVKAPNFRLASRTVNTLKAGVPIHDYTEMRDLPLVLLNLLEADVVSVVASLKGAFSWRNKTVVLYESELDTESLQPLRSAGANVATLNNVGGFSREQFVIESDSTAAREIRSCLLGRSTHAVEIPPGHKRAYLHSVYLATQIFPSFVAEIAETLRSTQLSKTESDRMTALMLTEAMSWYFRAGRRNVPIDIDWDVLQEKAKK